MTVVLDLENANGSILHTVMTKTLNHYHLIEFIKKLHVHYWHPFEIEDGTIYNIAVAEVGEREVRVATARMHHFCHLIYHGHESHHQGSKQRFIYIIMNLIPVIQRICGYQHHNNNNSICPDTIGARSPE